MNHDPHDQALRDETDRETRVQDSQRERDLAAADIAEVMSKQWGRRFVQRILRGKPGRLPIGNAQSTAYAAGRQEALQDIADEIRMHCLDKFQLMELEAQKARQ